MKKKITIYLSIFIALIIGITLIILINFKKEPVINVELIDKLDIPFSSEIKVSKLIKSINGKIDNDFFIDTSKIGKQEITIKYKNDNGKYVKYSFEINIYDDVAPVVWLSNSYSLPVNSETKLEDKILCGDNYDSNPKCEIIGEYDAKTIGNYKLTYKATDSSNNIAEIPFTLNVYEPKKGTNISSTRKTLFSDILTKYKTDQTRIGIDVSGWQGDIDFNLLKQAGVEFVIIRVGGTIGMNGDYFVDKKFIQNIKNANEIGIDVGLYYFSYANSIAKAKKDAEWLLKQIKDYKVNLPIAFDWENWSNYNAYHLSFYELTKMADSFLDIIADNGYQGMIYGSKNYLEKIWLDSKYDTWLAHYASNTNYANEFKFWQICDNGVVDGINGYVDIDIMYK